MSRIKRSRPAASSIAYPPAIHHGQGIAKKIAAASDRPRVATLLSECRRDDTSPAAHGHDGAMWVSMATEDLRAEKAALFECLDLEGECEHILPSHRLD
jgi:hypothetical protein